MIFFQSPPSPRDAPESGGEGIFSGKEEGYGMTLHANNGKPCCISFRFMNFYSQRGHPPHLSDATEGGRVNFFIDIGRGVVYDYSCKKLQT